jgi:excisionase family DNA binding protein
MGDELMSLDDAAQHMGVHRETIKRRIAEGELPAFVGADRRRRFVRRIDVDRLAQPMPVKHTRRPRAATPATAS